MVEVGALGQLKTNVTELPAMVRTWKWIHKMNKQTQRFISRQTDLYHLFRWCAVQFASRRPKHLIWKPSVTDSVYADVMDVRRRNIQTNFPPPKTKPAVPHFDGNCVKKVSTNKCSRFIIVKRDKKWSSGELFIPAYPSEIKWKIPNYTTSLLRLSYNGICATLT